MSARYPEPLYAYREEPYPDPPPEVCAHWRPGMELWRRRDWDGWVCAECIRRELLTDENYEWMET